MNKSDLLKHLQRVAAASTSRKRLNGTHVRVITNELFSVWAKSLEEHGSVSMSGFGRFDVHKRTGKIQFTPFKSWSDQIGGAISTSSLVEEEEENEEKET